MACTSMAPAIWESLGSAARAMIAVWCCCLAHSWTKHDTLFRESGSRCALALESSLEKWHSAESIPPNRNRILCQLDTELRSHGILAPRILQCHLRAGTHETLPCFCFWTVRTKGNVVRVFCDVTHFVTCVFVCVLYVVFLVVLELVLRTIL